MTDLVLADDHTVFVDALSILLIRNGFTISAVADTIARAVAAVAKYEPQVCVIDRHFADGDSVDSINRMLAKSPRTRILVLSADRDKDGMARALAAGASGYLHKSRPVDSLISAITEMLNGKVVVDLPRKPAVLRSPEDAAMHMLATHLTGREWECLALLMEGLDTAAIGTRLGVSRTTVRTHVQSLLTKLGLHSRLEAISFAARHRLLDDRPAGSRHVRAI